MDEYRFTTGDSEEAISIMKEATQWLIDEGKLMWRIEELNRECLKNPAEEYIVMYNKEGVGVAAMLLSFHDPFFWPDIQAGVSGFIHKLAIRRNYAGKGLANKLIEHAVSICIKRGVDAIRLDCDPHRTGLCRFYEEAGFSLINLKTIETEKMGVIVLALYKRDLHVSAKDSFLIFEVNREDIPECAEIIRRSFITVAEEMGLTKENAPTNPAFIEDSKLMEGLNAGIKMFGIKNSGRLVGFMALEKNDDTTYYLEKLAVLPEVRHLGYGGRFISYAVDYVKKAGGSNISIGIIYENKRLLKWYMKNGFIETGTKVFPHLPFTVCFMRLDIK